MRLLTRNFLRDKFREYYLYASLDLPPGFNSREWGFLLFDDSGMHRHKSYLSRGEIIDYIRGIIPAHVYHSAAYYQRPAAPTMKDKEWQGADLIFDLDADHLRKAPKSYPEMLKLVKKETLKLIDFLFEDFGFTGKNISIVFSGGRGYHIHIRDPTILKLGSDERREIVDYLTASGLDIDSLFSYKLVGGDAGVKKAKVRLGPRDEAGGWAGRLNSKIVSLAKEIRERPKDEAIRILGSVEGIGPFYAENFYFYVKDEHNFDQIKQGNLDGLKMGHKIWPNLIDFFIKKESLDLPQVSILADRDEPDQPVTGDVRRLIRCATSLHGGSGFRVTPLDLESLHDFDPLWDAVVFGDNPIPLEITKPFSTEIKGESYKLQEGRTELPAYAAIFLMARGVAELDRTKN
ncbi:MAG: DNA primase catalytic subunit PriS [Methanotrichaceae archaeon]|nr:DNA primase catalytic subunit PriS [Methanotrichaceae archaeon]